MKRGVKLFVNGHKEVFTYENEQFYDICNAHVGGFIEPTDLYHKLKIIEWHNEEYLYACTEQNPIANQIRISDLGNGVIPVFGNTVYTGLTDEEGWNQDLTDEQIEMLMGIKVGPYATNGQGQPLTNEEVVEVIGPPTIRVLTEDELRDHLLGKEPA